MQAFPPWATSQGHKNLRHIWVTAVLEGHLSLALDRQDNRGPRPRLRIAKDFRQENEFPEYGCDGCVGCVGVEQGWQMDA